MPFGKFVGKPLVGLPDWYVIWVKEWGGLCSWPSLSEYFASVGKNVLAK